MLVKLINEKGQKINTVIRYRNLHINLKYRKQNAKMNVPMDQRNRTDENEGEHK